MQTQYDFIRFGADGFTIDASKAFIIDSAKGFSLSNSAPTLIFLIKNIHDQEIYRVEFLVIEDGNLIVEDIKKVKDLIY
ncbi:MAG: hypothetical protein JEZ01_20495 [Labilibaculum sp.]|nr:hypothetical protein [Labilibaculum sp.]MBI9060159.1 hypothetical protein [Labilibaculum sp.]